MYLVIGGMKGVEATEFLNCISFVKISADYRALTSGALGDWPTGKLWAVLKGVIQSISPCLDQERMKCVDCSFKKACCFFHLMGEEKKDFRPYVISMPNPLDWTGLIAKGEVNRFSCCLIGEKTTLAQEIEIGFRKKKLICLDGVNTPDLRCELADIEISNNGNPVDVGTLVKLYTRQKNFDIFDIRRITLHFVSPVQVKSHNRILKDPDEMDFEVFLPALHNRLYGLATEHCDFQGELQSSDRLMDSMMRTVSTSRHPDFRHFDRWAKKKGLTRRKLPKGYSSDRNIGGFMGHITFEGKLASFFPSIVLGEALHIGKKTAQGLGKYRVIEINDVPVSVDRKTVL